MTTTAEFRTFAEMESSSEFVQYLERLRSGSLLSNTGVNRVLQRLARNTDALLDVLQSSRNTVLSGGDTFSWSAAGPAFPGTFTISATLNIRYVNDVQGTVRNYVNSGSFTLDDGDVLWVKLDRASNDAIDSSGHESWSDFLTRLTVTDPEYRLDYLVLAYRDDSVLVLCDGRRIRNGEELTDRGSCDSQYAQQNEADYLRLRQKQNFQCIISGGGTLGWDYDSGDFSFSSHLNIVIPALAGLNRINTSESPVTIGPNQVAYVSLERSAAGLEDLTPVVVDVDEAALDDDDVFVLAYCGATGERLFLWNGMSLADGEEAELGATRAGVQWFFRDVGDATQVTDLNHEYRVGSGELMVYRNGLKAKTSAAFWDGTLPAGSLSGALEGYEDYIEERPSGETAGERVIWLRDNSGDAVGHADDEHEVPYSWPSSNDLLEAFVGIQGQPAGKVSSIGIQGAPGDPLDGDVEFTEGPNISIDYNGSYIRISASITAGVSKLFQGADEAVGDVELEGGTNITISVDPVTNKVTWACDVEALSDLADVSADLEAAVLAAGESSLGTHAPGNSNPLTTVDDVLAAAMATADTIPIRGFDVIRFTTEDIYVGAGMALIQGVPLLVEDGTLVVNYADVYSGESLTDDDWNYLYVMDDGAGALTGVVSPTAPGDDGKHPAPVDPDFPLRFLSSFYYVDGGGSFPYIRRGVKRGEWVDLSHGVELSSKASWPVGGMWAAAVDLSGVLPPGVASVRLLVSFTMPASSPSSKFCLVGVTDYYPYNGMPYRSYKVPWVGSGQATVEVECSVNYSDGADSPKLYFITSSNITSVDSVMLVGYSEGRYAVGTPWSDST